MANKNAAGAGGADDTNPADDVETEETDDQTQDDDTSGEGDEGKGKGVSHSTYKKTLTEAKNAKSKLRKMAEEKAALEERLLAAEGNKDEKIKSLMTKNAELKKRERELMGTTVKKALSDQVKTQAQKAGCLHPDKVMRLLDLSDVEVDSDTLEADEGLIGEKLTDLKKEMPQLFSKAGPKINGKMPKGEAGDEREEKEDFSKLSMDEIKKRLRELDKKK